MKPSQLDTLLEAIFEEESQLFSYNFAFFERPMFELNRDQKIRDLNDVFSEFEQEHLYETLLKYKKLKPVSVEPTPKRGFYRIFSQGKWIGDCEESVSGKFIVNTYHRHKMIDPRTHLKKKLCVLDSIEEVCKYLSVNYPKILLSKDLIRI